MWGLQLIRLLPCTLLLCLPQSVSADQGKEAFEQHCQACHAKTESLVGPSLSEIRALYPETKRQDFVNWTKSPGKKRDGAIQMPAMSHLGEQAIKQIHRYILQAELTATKTNKRHQFSFKPPAKTYPYYQRGVMPFASPASIGVMFAPGFGINWDATPCRLRYAFASEKSFFRGEKDQEELKDALIYQETAPELWSFAEGKQPRFLGYRLNGALPQFEYELNGIRISEQLLPIKNTLGFKRSFTLTGVVEPIHMNLRHTGDVQLSASSGVIDNNLLMLTSQQAKQFEIIVRVSQ